METQTEAQLEKKGISKDTTISEVLTLNPQQATLLTDIMTGFGIHCVGCGAATFETLEQGVMGHGFSEEQLNKLVSDLNKAIEQNPTETKTISTQDFKLTLTSQALIKVKEAIKQRGKENASLKVSVLAGGCSGFLYDLQFIDEPSSGDLNFKQEDVNVAVDKNSMEQLDGIEIDYVDTLNESGFKFTNPNAQAGCGCGKSFG